MLAASIPQALSPVHATLALLVTACDVKILTSALLQLAIAILTASARTHLALSPAPVLLAIRVLVLRTTAKTLMSAPFSLTIVMPELRARTRPVPSFALAMLVMLVLEPFVRMSTNAACCLTIVTCTPLAAIRRAPSPALVNAGLGTRATMEAASLEFSALIWMNAISMSQFAPHMPLVPTTLALSLVRVILVTQWVLRQD